MIMTQRYPSYFDGVVVGDPAMRTGVSGIGNNWATVAYTRRLRRTMPDERSPTNCIPTPTKKLNRPWNLNACDANDGLKDSMVFNTKACKFDPTVLQCHRRKDGCLPGGARR